MKEVRLSDVANSVNGNPTWADILRVGHTSLTTFLPFSFFNLLLLFR